MATAPIYSEFIPIGEMGGRVLAIVTYQGRKKLLYRSTGTGSSHLTESKWCPCDGVLLDTIVGDFTDAERKRRRAGKDAVYMQPAPWIIKHRYVERIAKTDPLYKLGSADALRLSENLQALDREGALPRDDTVHERSIRGGIAVNLICKRHGVTVMTANEVGNELVKMNVLEGFGIDPRPGYEPSIFERIRDYFHGF